MGTAAELQVFVGNLEAVRGGGKLHCSSLKINRLRYILAFAPRNVPCRNGDCRSGVARGPSAEHLTARSAVPSPDASRFDPVITPK